MYLNGNKSEKPFIPPCGFGHIPSSSVVQRVHAGIIFLIVMTLIKVAFHYAILVTITVGASFALVVGPIISIQALAPSVWTVFFFIAVQTPILATITLFLLHVATRGDDGRQTTELTGLEHLEIVRSLLGLEAQIDFDIAYEFLHRIKPIVAVDYISRIVLAKSFSERTLLVAAFISVYTDLKVEQILSTVQKPELFQHIENAILMIGGLFGKALNLPEEVSQVVYSRLEEGVAIQPLPRQALNVQFRNGTAEIVGTPDNSSCTIPHDEQTPAGKCKTCVNFIDVIQTKLSAWFSKPVSRNYNGCVTKHDVTNPSHQCGICFPDENEEFEAEDLNEGFGKLVSKLSKILRFEGASFSPEKHGFWLSSAVGSIMLTFMFLKANSSHVAVKAGHLASYVDLVTKAGNFFRAKKFMDEGLKSTFTAVMRFLYSLLGHKYLSKAERALVKRNRRILEIRLRCEEWLALAQTDFFAFMRKGCLDRLELLNKEILSLYSDLTTEEKSLLNMRQHLDRIDEIFRTLKEMSAAVIASSVGKQTPVRIWVYGPAGTGKTTFVDDLGAKLEQHYGIEQYQRNCMDEFWSKFYGQSIIKYDDILQRKDGLDAAEWVLHAHSATSSAVGAAIGDKGKFVNPLFMLASSIYAGLLTPQESKVIRDAASLHRRRDLVIQAYNPVCSEYQLSHGAQPPRELFMKNPTRYFLMRPLPKPGEKVDEQYVTDANGERIEVTLDSVFEWAVNKELSERSYFRERCERSKMPIGLGDKPKFDASKLDMVYASSKPIPTNSPIPPCRLIDGDHRYLVVKPQNVIEVSEDEQKRVDELCTAYCFYNVAYLLRQTTKQCTVHHLTPSQRLDVLEKVATMTGTESAVMALEIAIGLSQEVCQPFGKQRIEKKHFFSVLILGPPGTGKSVLSETAQRMGARVIDDFTLTAARMDEAREGVDDFWTGKTDTPVVLTANEKVARMSGHGETLDLISRRAVVIRTEFQRNFFGKKYTSADTAKCASQAEFDRLVACFINRNGRRYQMSPSSTSGIVESLVGDPDQVVRVVESHVAPRMPSPADPMVTLKFEDMNAKETCEYLQNWHKHLLNLQSRILHSKDTSFMDMLKIGKELGAAMPDGTSTFKLESLVTTFNAQNARVSKEFTALINTSEGSVAFASTLQHGVVAWMVDEAKEVALHPSGMIIDGTVHEVEGDNQRFVDIYERTKFLLSDRMDPKAPERVPAVVAGTSNGVEGWVKTLSQCLSLLSMTAIAGGLVRSNIKVAKERSLGRTVLKANPGAKVENGTIQIPRTTVESIPLSPSGIAQNGEERKSSEMQVSPGNKLDHDWRDNTAVHVVRQPQTQPKNLEGSERGDEKSAAIQQQVSPGNRLDHDWRDNTSVHVARQPYVRQIVSSESQGDVRGPVARQQQVSPGNRLDHDWRDNHSVHVARQPGGSFGSQSDCFLTPEQAALEESAYEGGDERQEQFVAMKPCDTTKMWPRSAMPGNPRYREYVKVVENTKGWDRLRAALPYCAKSFGTERGFQSQGTGKHNPTDKQRKIVKMEVQASDWQTVGSSRYRLRSFDQDRVFSQELTLAQRQAVKTGVSVTYSFYSRIGFYTFQGESQPLKRLVHNLARKWQRSVLLEYAASSNPLEIFSALEEDFGVPTSGDFVSKGDNYGFMWNGEVWTSQQFEDRQVLVKDSADGWVRFADPNLGKRRKDLDKTLVEGASFAPVPQLALFNWIVYARCSDLNGTYSLETPQLPDKQNCQDVEAIQLMDQLETKHLVGFENTCNPDKFSCWGIVIKNNIVLTVGHLQEIQGKVSRLEESGWVSYTVKRIFSSSHYDASLWAITDTCFQPVKDISKRFMTDADLGSQIMTGTSTMLNLLRTKRSDKRHRGFIVSMRLRSKFSTLNAPRTTFLHHDVFTNSAMGSDNVTMRGDCGLPYIRYQNNSERKIYGIHAAGSATTAECTTITQELLAEWMTLSMSSQAAVEERTVVVREFDGWIPFTNEEGNLRYYLSPTQHGAVVGEGKYVVMVPNKTTLYRTGLVVPEEFDIFEPSILSSRDARSPGLRIVDSGLANYCFERTPLNREEIREAYRHIGAELASRMMSKGCHLRKLTLEEAINGLPHSEYVESRPINRKSAVGFPYSRDDKVTQKEDYLWFDEKTLHWKVKASHQGQSLHRAVNSLEQDYSHGSKRGVVFTCYGKDELLKRKKIYGDKRKTRVFMSAPMPYTLVHRKYFLSAFDALQSIRAETPVKIGINATSMEWDELYHFLTSVGVYGFDADAANWDARIPVEFQEEICEHLWNPLFRALDPDWKQQDDVIRSAIHSAVEKPFVIDGRMIKQLDGGQVSGQPGTAVENSLINWALCYIVWKRSLAKSPRKEEANYESFRKNVRFACYGDDIVICVASEFLEYFNAVVYAEEARKLDFDITDAQKTGEIRPYMHISEMSFLRRSFKRLNNVVVGPLEMTSIVKGLIWQRGGRGYDASVTVQPNGVIEFPTRIPDTNVESMMGHAFCELALHGEKTFEEWRAILLPQMPLLGISISVGYWSALEKMGIPVSFTPKP